MQSVRRCGRAFVGRKESLRNACSAKRASAPARFRDQSSLSRGREPSAACRPQPGAGVPRLPRPRAAGAVRVRPRGERSGAERRAEPPEPRRSWGCGRAAPAAGRARAFLPVRKGCRAARRSERSAARWSVLKRAMRIASLFK